MLYLLGEAYDSGVRDQYEQTKIWEDRADLRKLALRRLGARYRAEKHENSRLLGVLTHLGYNPREESLTTFLQRVAPVRRVAA